jgi:hypothetical protein
MASIRQVKSGKWRAEIRNKSAGQKSKYFDTKEQAESWSKQIEELSGDKKVEICHAILMVDAPMSESHILAHSQRRMKFTGVYFLVMKNKIIYVGQSKDMQRRVMQHDKNGVDFDGFYYYPCEPTRAKFLEAFYINKFKPFLNRASERTSLDAETNKF